MAPPPLGMTIAANGCSFDDKPPKESSDESGKKPSRLEKVTRWLEDQLANGPVPLRRLIERAKECGYGTSSLYEARKVVGVIEVEDGRRRVWRMDDEGEETSFRRSDVP